MKNIFTILLISITMLSASAQIGGFKKLKNKAKKSVQSKNKPDSREMVSTLKIEGEAKSQLNLLKGYFEGDELANVPKGDIEKALGSLLTKTKTLKNYYAAYSTQLKSLQDGHSKYKNLATTEFSRRENSGKLVEEITFLSDRINTFKTKQKGYMVDYKRFADSEVGFKQLAEQDDAYKKDLDNIQNYFDEFLPKVYAPKLEKELMEGMFSYAFDDNSWKESPDAGITRIQRELKKTTDYFMTDYKPKFKDAKALEAFKAKLQKREAFLIDYRDNGDFEKYKSSVRLAASKKVFPSKAATQNSAINQLITKNHNTAKYGKIKKIIITRDWRVNKNDYDLPTYKSLAFQIITEKENNCYLNRSIVYRDYEGAGVYGKKQVKQDYGIELMYCPNATKTKN